MPHAHNEISSFTGHLVDSKCTEECAYLEEVGGVVPECEQCLVLPMKASNYQEHYNPNQEESVLLHCCR
jgi:hypothetical protein